MEIRESQSQQERLQMIAEKRRRQVEIENKRRQLEDDRRQLQHLKSKALRERWLLDGAPASTPEEDEATKKQMQEDELKTRELEDTIQRLESEIELLESGLSSTSTKESLADEQGHSEPENQDTVRSQKIIVNAARVVHAVRSEMAASNDAVHPLSSTEVEDLINKAEEATLHEISLTSDEKTQISKTSPRKEIPGVQARPPQASPGPEQPVTMIFMGYQNVEDENETKKVLGLEEAITAELVVIGDGDAQAATDGDLPEKAQHPPNGAPADSPNKNEKTEANDTAPPKSGEQDLSMKKQRCKCCSVM
ncbi:paralemmin-1 isoform X3 [Hyperolius riggenbachi]|uniref:paralemmin-1 isoform X3 n=1 Tax=Hyperolius riggenbachi TaxID=752182 RepID=UPI0035A3C26E